MPKDNREKIRRLTSEYMEKQSMLEEQRARRRKGLVRRLSAVAIVFLLITIFAGLTFFQQQASISEQKKVNQEMEEELLKMEREEANLEQEIEWLHDPEYIAEIARRDFFLTKDGETLFQLPRSQQNAD